MAGDGQTSTAIQLSHYRAIEQRQQSLERAAIAGGGVELEGKSASIKSISECIQLELHAMLALAGNSIEGDFGAGFGIACHCCSVSTT